MATDLNASERKAFPMADRWEAVAEPARECNQAVFRDFFQRHGHRRNVLNCAIPSARAKALTDFTMPEGWNLDKSLIASVGFGGPVAPGFGELELHPEDSGYRRIPMRVQNEYASDRGRRCGGQVPVRIGQVETPLRANATRKRNHRSSLSGGLAPTSFCTASSSSSRKVGSSRRRNSSSRNSSGSEPNSSDSAAPLGRFLCCMNTSTEATPG